MKYIIMCGGDYTSFETPRWLTTILGETFIERTIRLLKELGVTDINISSNSDIFDDLGIPILKHNNKLVYEKYNKFTGYWVDAFYPTEEPACYICGDVWYSKEALETIVTTETDDILFFGTAKPFHPAYPKPYEDPLAFKVVNQKRFRECIDRVKYLQDNKLTNRLPISWELYRVIDGIDPNKHILGKRFIGIHDFTIDIDQPEQKQMVEEAVKKYLKLSQDKTNGEIAICAVAKCENDYINDWVNYHINLGVDKIYIYDNNDESYEPLESRIIENIDKVEIIKIPGLKEFQVAKYNEFYNSHNYSWNIFIDIDEYIILNKWKNIKEFLNDDIFNDYNVIKLNWHMYGDDNLLDRDTSVPVNEFFKHRLKGHWLEKHGKEIIRGCVKGVKIKSTHWCEINGNLPKQIMPDGKETVGQVHSHHNCEEAYINHYMTKTLCEFIDQKVKRGTDACFGERVIDFEYFWKINTKTEKKLQYIKRKGF